jgi:hypothetical protein
VLLYTTTKMSVLLYAIESWVIAIVGLSWLSIRTLFDHRSFLEEYLLYSQAAVTSIHLVISGLSTEHNGSSRAYFTFNIVQWMVGVVCLMDSLLEISTNSLNLNANDVPLFGGNITSSICCPNVNISSWNKQIYFGGFQMFLIPMSITMAFQTVQLIVAAGGLLNTQKTVWTGNTFGYTVMTYSSMLLTIKYLDFFTLPCPNGDINIFSGFIVVKQYFMLHFFTMCFMFIALTENILLAPKPKMIWNVLGLGIIGLFLVSVYLNMHSSNIITWQWIVFVCTGILAIAYGFTETLAPTDAVKVASRIGEKIRNRTRFVMPMHVDPMLQECNQKNSKRD